MYWKLFLTMIIVFVKYSSSSRRIVNGREVTSDQRFMVYLLKSDKSTMQLYDSWLCGGAIVSPTHILTSAACLSDVTYLYAIAGYNKYVKSENLEDDECTKKRKRKVIKTCIPKKYTLNFQYVVDWAYLDIGIAIVKEPYDFSDVTYRRECSYVPASIKINYDPKYQEVDTDMLVFGWGHSRTLRLPGDTNDYNQEYLHVATTRVAEKKYCSDHFKNLTSVIEKFLICCNGQGYIQLDGKMDGPVPNNTNGCSRRRDNNVKKCDDYLYYDYGFDSRRTNENKTKSPNTTSYPYSKINKNRRQGVICQNDHGGPLVTWIGSEMYVVGVAITSLYSATFECIAPHIFTSTVCTSLFIKCAIGGLSSESQRRTCENMGEEVGYEIHETDIDWSKIDGNQNDVNITQKSVLSSPDNLRIFKWNRNNSENNPKDGINVGENYTRTNLGNQNRSKYSDGIKDLAVVNTSYFDTVTTAEEIAII